MSSTNNNSNGDDDEDELKNDDDDDDDENVVVAVYKNAIPSPLPNISLCPATCHARHVRGSSSWVADGWAGLGWTGTHHFNTQTHIYF